MEHWTEHFQMFCPNLDVFRRNFSSWSDSFDITTSFWGIHVKDSSPVEVSDPAKKMRNDASGIAVNFHTMTAPCIIQQVERSHAPIPSLSFCFSKGAIWQDDRICQVYELFLGVILIDGSRARAQRARPDDVHNSIKNMGQNVIIKGYL